MDKVFGIMRCIVCAALIGAVFVLLSADSGIGLQRRMYDLAARYREAQFVGVVEIINSVKYEVNSEFCGARYTGKVVSKFKGAKTNSEIDFFHRYSLDEGIGKMFLVFITTVNSMEEYGDVDGDVQTFLIYEPMVNKLIDSDDFEKQALDEKIDVHELVRKFNNEKRMIECDNNYLGQQASELIELLSNNEIELEWGRYYMDDAMVVKLGFPVPLTWNARPLLVKIDDLIRVLNEQEAR